MRARALGAVGPGDLAIAALCAVGAGVWFLAAGRQPSPGLWVLGATAGWLAAIAWLLAVTDVRTHRLPDKLLLTAAAVLIPASILAAALEADGWMVIQGVLGCVVVGAFMTLAHIASRGTLGRGDVKLSLVSSYWLGLMDPLAPAWGLIFGFVLSGLAALALMGTGKLGMRDYLPMGPGLLAGAVLATIVA